MKLVLSILFCLGLSACFTPRSQGEHAAAGEIHVVRAGDNLHKIAQKHRVSTEELMEMNGLSSPESLRSGQILFIPETNTSNPTPGKKSSPQKIARVEKDNDDKRTILFDWPVKHGVLFRGFDPNPNHIYEGIAFGAPADSEVLAAADGQIIFVGDQGTHYGQVVIIRHADPFVTVYAHLDHTSVSQGAQVKKGEPIGIVGTTGGVESPRVYFQVRKNRVPVNPENYLPRSG